MRAICVTAMVAAAGACTKWAATEMPPPKVQVAGSDSVPPHQWGRVRLNLDGGQVLVLRNAAVVGDSIRGAPDAGAVDTVASSIVVAVRSIRRFEVRRTDPLRTGIFFGVLAGLAALSTVDARTGDFNVSIPCGILGTPCPAP